MNEFRADLHCHTTCSDGSASPSEIIHLAQERKLQGLSITDHDTIAAYEEAIPLARQAGITLISGVELSTMHRNTSIHILAYSFSPDSPIIKNFCHKHHERRLKRNREILALLSQHGMPLSEEDLHHLAHTQPNQSVGRPHIAMAMMQKGYVGNLQEAFVKHIGEGKPCYSPGSSYSVEETIQTIHDAKGLAIIAHPHLIEDIKIVKELLEMPFDGLEGYYARFKLHQQMRWIKIAQYRGWLITGGSDFHGTVKPATYLGSSWIDQNHFNPLYERFKSNGG